MFNSVLVGGVVILRQGQSPVDVTPSCHGAQMESSGAVRYWRGIMRVVTPEAVAEQLAEVRRAAAAFGIGAVAGPLEQAAQEALAVARTEEEAELPRQLVVVARRMTVRRNLRQ